MLLKLMALYGKKEILLVINESQKGNTLLVFVLRLRSFNSKEGHKWGDSVLTTIQSTYALFFYKKLVYKKLVLR